MRGALRRCGAVPPTWLRRSACWRGRRACLRAIPWPLTPRQLVIAAGIVVLAFLLVQFVRMAQRSARLRVCRAGWSGFSIRSPISASRAGSCGRSAFCFWCSRRCPVCRARLAIGAGDRNGARRFPVRRDRRAGSVRDHRQAYVRTCAAARRRNALIRIVFSPFTWRAAYASLPSGHATTAFSVLVAFGTLWPRARTILLDLRPVDRGRAAWW